MGIYDIVMCPCGVLTTNQKFEQHLTSFEHLHNIGWMLPYSRGFAPEERFEVVSEVWYAPLRHRERENGPFWEEDSDGPWSTRHLFHLESR